MFVPEIVFGELMRFVEAQAGRHTTPIGEYEHAEGFIAVDLNVLFGLR